MSIVAKLEAAVSRLDKTDDYVEISNIGDEIWDLVDEMSGTTDPAVLPLLGRAMDSEAAMYFVEKAVDVVGAIGGEAAEKILAGVRSEYTDTEDEVYIKCGELLASINPTQYIGTVSADTQYQVIRRLAKKGSVDDLSAIIGLTSDGVHLVNALNMTLVWVALEADNLAFCQYLLEAKVDTSKKNVYGETATEYAVKNGNKTATYLVQNT